MATNGEPPKKRKRLTIEDVNISAPVYDPPKHFSVSGLYNPTLVSITVINEDEGDDWQQKFKLPLDLIASRSKYFKTLFENGFAESESGSVKLQDVSPWMFRTFVGWLYHQNILYDPEYKPPRKFKKLTTSTTSKPKLSKTSPALEGEAAEAVRGETGRGVLAATKQTSPSVAKEKPAQLPTELPKTTYNHPPGGNTRKFSQEATITYGDSDSTDECNYRDPTTWPCKWLFELYIFSNKYDIPDFRAAIFDIIQMKFFQEWPRSYPLPTNSEVILAVENLPTQSPLYRLLVDCWAIWVNISAPEADAEHQARVFEDFPAHFLSRCLVKAKRAELARRCSNCGPDCSGNDCDSDEHSWKDYVLPPNGDLCRYHEHNGDDAEKARCVLRWESRRHRLQS